MRFVILAIGLCGVASAALLARYGLQAGNSPVGLAAWRLVLASLALIAAQAFRRPKVKLVRAEMALAVVAGIFLAAHFATWIASLDYVSIARSTLLVSTSPLWAGLLGFLIPSLRPKPIFWAGLLVAGIGTFLVTTEGAPPHAAATPAWLGDVLAAIGAICIVPYLLISQRIQRRAGTLQTVTWIYSSAAIALLIFLAAFDDLRLPGSAQAWASIVGMAIFAQLIGHSSLNFCLKQFSAAQIATSSLLEPVFAGALAWTILGERLSLLQGLGGCVLLLGVAFCLRAEPEGAIVPAAD